MLLHLEKVPVLLELLARIIRFIGLPVDLALTVQEELKATLAQRNSKVLSRRKSDFFFIIPSLSINYQC